MAKTVAVGIQNFEELIQKECLYIDKTSFIKEWWESKDSVTLITRPRRFGKTLNMSMLEQFFSITYAQRGDLFEGLFIWEDEKYRRLQGTYPVIGLTFADVKEQNYENAREKIEQILAELYRKYSFLWESDALTDLDRIYFDKILSAGAGDVDLSSALRRLSDFVFNAKREKSLEDTLASALSQIEEKQYDKGLIAQGIAPGRIRRYGFAFEGKHVLIG